MLKKIVTSLLILMLVLLVLAGLIVSTGNILPKDAEQKIQQLSQQPVPEFFPGETYYAKNQQVKIWYEIRRPTVPLKGTIVLSMGAGGTATFWPEYVLQPLLAKGYQVIRYDYRGTGMSDWLDEWTEDTAYTLTDMTNDIVAILDQQNIQKAHIIGMSFGGGVARHFLHAHPERTASLSMVVSTGVFSGKGSPRVEDVPLLAIPRLLLRHGLWSNETDRVKFILGVMHLMNHGADHKLHDELVIQQALYEIRKRRGFNPESLKHHMVAMKKTLTTGIQNKPINRPVLYIIGDRDPVVTVDSAKIRLEQEPDSKLLILPGVSHVVTEPSIVQVVDALDEHMVSASQI